MEDSKFGNM